ANPFQQQQSSTPTASSSGSGGVKAELEEMRRRAQQQRAAAGGGGPHSGGEAITEDDINLALAFLADVMMHDPGVKPLLPLKNNDATFQGSSDVIVFCRFFDKVCMIGWLFPSCLTLVCVCLYRWYQASWRSV